MYNYQIRLLGEADDPNRKPYILQGDDAHNCGTVACDIVKDNLNESGIPAKTNARPVKMIQEVLNSAKKALRIGYDPTTNTTTRGGEYQKSEDEKKTDEKMKEGE